MAKKEANYKKKAKQNNTKACVMKVMAYVIATLLLGVAIVIGIILYQNRQGMEEPEISIEDTDLHLGSGVNVISIGSYFGGYVEDGSDELVKDTMMIIIENTGDKQIQVMQVTVNGTYVFDLTTLLPGEKMMVLEKNRAKYKEGMEITSVTVSNVAFFKGAPSMQEDKLQIVEEDGFIIITNIGGTTIAGGRVFYKNTVDDVLLGGITYSVTFPRLEPGQTVKMSSKHYTTERSKLIFVNYEEQ